MKTPVFWKSIRFRLALWYSIFLILLMVILLVGINTIMINSRPDISEMHPPFPGDSQAWRQVVESERFRNMQDLRLFSFVGAGLVLMFGAVGGYLLAGSMLKPVDHASSLAGRISYTNLKERINYRGPKDEVKRLADTFDNMLQRLELSLESQKQFIQDASHELRTPIAIAQTNIEVLEMNHRATIQEYKQLMDVLKLSLCRMNSVNNSMLLLSEETPAKAKWTKVDVSVLLHEVYAETRIQAKSKGINIEMMPLVAPISVLGDSLRLKQAIINLVENGIIYNRPQGSIRLSGRMQDKNAIIEIQDNGIGIKAKDLPHIFDRFYRVDQSRNREKGGSGLGLAIVKKIIEDHGGAVLAESTIGEGSTFRITLPLET
jgi:two-component system sensor histidine kinase ArlS